MDINTTISIDMDDLANELEDYIREIAEDQINQNDNSFQDNDDVQQLINESMMDVADNTDIINEITTEYRDLRNEVEKLRRSMRVLLEERERSIKKRAGRAVQATTRTFSDMVRKVHWYMPRR